MSQKTHLLESHIFKFEVFLVTFFCFSILQPVYSQSVETIPFLELNKSIEKEINAPEKQNFQINLGEKQFVTIVVEQRGIDVAARVFNLKDKRALLARDSILKTEGQEKISLATAVTASYRLEIEAKSKLSKAGKYTIVVTEMRPATEREIRLEEARNFHNEAIRLWNAGELKEAFALAERALDIREQDSGEESDIAASLANLALIVADQGDYDRAISLYERAIKLREKVFGFEHQDTARTYHNMAIVFDNTGDYEKAISNYEKAIKIRETVFGQENAELATSLSNLGLVYEKLADYGKAEQLMLRGLEIKEKVLPPTSNSIAYSLSNLAGINSAKGDEDKALGLYRRALEIREKALGAEHPDVARSLEYLATSYVTKGDLEQAEKHYLRSLKILQKVFEGKDHYRIARLLGSLAILYNQQINYAKAEPLFQQTVEMMEKTVGREHIDYATALFNQAEFYTNKADYQKAESLYHEAVSIVEKKISPQHPDLVTYLNGLARNHQAKGETLQAVKNWSRAHKISERNMQLVLFTNSERQKLLYLESIAGETNQYVSAHQTFAPDSSEALQLALTTIFERKGRVSDAVAMNFAVLRGRFNKDDQDLLDKLKETTGQLAQKILNAKQNSTIEEYQKTIAALEERKENLEMEISRRSSQFNSVVQPVSIAAIQFEIPENAALIEYGIYRPFRPQVADANQAYGEPRYVAYVVRRKGAIEWKDLGSTKSIDETIDSFRKALRDPQRKDVQTLARTLDAKILQPLRSSLVNVSQLLISPDGELNLIPFEALVDEQNRYRIENHSFSYLTSGRDLLRMRIPRESKNKSLLIANPTFGEFSTRQNSKVSDQNPAARRSVTVARDLSETYFAPLGGTAQEARTIYTLFPEATFLTGEKANEFSIKQTIAPRILHVATHGFFLEDRNLNSDAESPTPNVRNPKVKSRIENPLIRSGLALAGANQRDSAGDDGILTALEATSLNLWGTKLVVLSACDTGIGEVKNGEGVYGLRRAFVLAGAESLVMSLWSVSDYVTRELMTNYYRNLKKGAGRAAALRSVQLEMLKKNNRQHPFYWAGFIQSGEWANLDGKR